MPEAMKEGACAIVNRALLLIDLSPKQWPKNGLGVERPTPLSRWPFSPVDGSKSRLLCRHALLMAGNRKYFWAGLRNKVSLSESLVAVAGYCSRHENRQDTKARR